MMAGLFVLYLVAIVLAMRKARNLSILVFFIALGVSAYWFVHHATEWPSIVL